MKIATNKVIAMLCASVVVLCAYFYIHSSFHKQTLDKSTKSLKLAYSDNVGSLNPQGYGKNAMFAQNLVFEGLVRLDKNGAIIPSLATSWSVDTSGKIYIFNLRKGVRFSNGEEFNADAVVLNFKSILQNRVRHSWSGLIEAIQSVEKIDDYAVRIVLKSPYAPTLNELALVRPFRFLAPSAFPPDLDLIKHNPVSIGTGAYMLAESKAGAFDKFVKNPLYWGAQPNASATNEEVQNQASTNQQGGFYYDEVLIKVIFEPNSKLAALRAGQVDMIYGADEIPTRIFMEVANAQGGFCHTEPLGEVSTKQPLCHTEPLGEVSQGSESRDISAFSKPQYDKDLDSSLTAFAQNDKENSPSLAERGLKGWVDSINDNERGKNPQKNPEFKAYLGKEAFITSLLLNSTRLQNAQLREAIALSIDKNALINAVYGTNDTNAIASPADSLFVYGAETSHLSLRGSEANSAWKSTPSSHCEAKPKQSTKIDCYENPSGFSRNDGFSCHTEGNARSISKNSFCRPDPEQNEGEVSQSTHNRDISAFSKPQYDDKHSPSRSTSGALAWVNPSTNTLNSESTPQNLAQPHETNLQQAREILSQLGYTASNPLRLTLLHKGDKPNQKMLSLILQAQLKRANITLSVRALEPSMYHNALKNGEFEIAFSESWGAPYEPLSQLYSFTKPLGHGDYLAQSGLPNKSEIDALILQAINAPNPKQAQRNADKAIALLLESRVYIPLVLERNKAIARGRIKGVETVSGVIYEIPVWEFWE